MRGKNILITGGAGFIGSHLVARFAKANKLTVLDDLSTGHMSNLKGQNLRFVKGSVTNKALVDRLCKGIDFVFHLAAKTSVPESIAAPQKFFDVNVTGSMNVLNSCAKHHVKKFLFASSAAVYGDAPGLPKQESMHTLPLSPYASSKAIIEQQALMMHKLNSLSFACLRLFNVYGPRQDPGSQYSGVISRFMYAASHSEPFEVYGDGNQTRDFVFVEDVALAFEKAAISHANGMFNIGCNSKVSINQLLSMIQQLAHSDSRVNYHESRPGDIRHSLADISKAKALLGWEPQTPIWEGLSATFEWFSKA